MPRRTCHAEIVAPARRQRDLPPRGISTSTPSSTTRAGSTKRPRRSITMSRPFEAARGLEAVAPVFLWEIIVCLLRSLHDAAFSRNY